MPQFTHKFSQALSPLFQLNFRVPQTYYGSWIDSVVISPTYKVSLCSPVNYFRLRSQPRLLSWSFRHGASACYHSAKKSYNRKSLEWRLIFGSCSISQLIFNEVGALLPFLLESPSALLCSETIGITPFLLVGACHLVRCRLANSVLGCY